MEATINYEFIVPKDKESEIVNYLKEIRKNAYRGTLLKQDFEIEDYNTILSKFQNEGLREVRLYISSQFKNVSPQDSLLFSVIKVTEKIDYNWIESQLKSMYLYCFKEDIKSIESTFSITIGAMQKRSWRGDNYHFYVWTFGR